MKRTKVLILCVLVCLVLFGVCACKAPEPQAVVLVPPTNLSIDTATNVLTWTKVDNASSYVVSTGAGQYTTTECSFDLSILTEPNTYTVRVMAIGDGKNYNNSGWTRITHTIVAPPAATSNLAFTLLQDGSGYAVSKGTATLSGRIIIPDTYNELPVTEISSRGFATIDSSGVYPSWRDNTTLTSVILPKNLKVIGENAFHGCKGLKTIEFPDTLTLIDTRAFFQCEALQDIQLPENLTTLGEGAFGGCSKLASIDLTHVTNLGDSVFSGCTALADITLPTELKHFGASVFNNTAWYTAWYASQPNGIINISNVVIRYKGTMAPNTVIDSFPQGTNMIANAAFSMQTGLKEVVIPDGWTTLGGNAIFGYCTSLTRVVFPDGFLTIGENMFYNCTMLSSVTLPDTLKEIGESAFYGCTALSEIDLPDSLTTIGRSAFASSGLTKVALPEGIATLNNGEFNDCVNLLQFTIPSTMAAIDNFSGCGNLVEIYNLSRLRILAGGITFGGIAQYALVVHSDKDAPSILMTTSDGYMFATLVGQTTVGILFKYVGTETALTLPTSYQYNDQAITQYSIFRNAFAQTNIVSVDMGSSVVSIGDRAFEQCSRLTSVVFSQNLVSIGEFSFSESGLAVVEIPDSVTSVGRAAFSHCRRLVKAVIGNGIVSLPQALFHDCINLKTLVVGSKVNAIAESSFLSCRILEIYNLSELVLEKGSTGYDGIARYALAIHEELTEPSSLFRVEGGFYFVEVANGTETEYALVGFDGNATTLSLPDSFTHNGASVTAYYINDYAFAYNSFIEVLTIPDNVTAINPQAFVENTALKSVSIGNGVVSIGNAAFAYCPMLETVIIYGEALQSIGNGVFAAQPSVLQYTVKDGARYLGNSLNPYLALIYLDFNDTTSFVLQSTTKLLANDYASVNQISSLEGITIDGSHARYHAVNNCLIETATKTLVLGCKNSTIPDDGSVEIIGRGAFTRCLQLTDIVIPTSIKSIGESAFAHTRMTSIVIPASVESIGKNAFYSSTLITAVLSEGVKVVGENAFYGCPLQTLVLPSTLTEIGRTAFINRASTNCDVYYNGSSTQLESLIEGKNAFNSTRATIYYYSATQPESSGNYWYFDANGNPKKWEATP